MTAIVEQFDDIRAHVARIRDAEVPRCPLTPAVRPADCLRTSTRCGPLCPHRDEWTGPMPAALPAGVAMLSDIAQVRYVLARHGILSKEPTPPGSQK